MRDRLQPRVGFNLHNQSWRTSVGDPPKPASISLLSVAFDKARSGSEGRTLTKKICAVIRDALEPFASGQIGRYDDEFEVRAFGDNLTLWGTPVVLIETGPWPAAEPDPALVRLNFVAILAALDALATGAVNRASPERYDSLPLNASAELYILVRNATVINGAGVPPYLATSASPPPAACATPTASARCRSPRPSTTWATCGRSDRCAPSTPPG